MATREPIRVESWQHCYNRGVDKRTVFEESRDYERFLTLLFLSNGTNAIRISDYRKWSLQKFLMDTSIDRGDPIVEIGAYALMPNHFHLILQEIVEGGIATFMLKVGTGYSMYFNKKHQRSGALFSGEYKSKHIHDDVYLQMAVPYVLLNPAALFDHKWKQGTANRTDVWQKLQEYRYSSLPDFIGGSRPESKIVGEKLSGYFETKPTLEEMIRNAQEYYSQNKSFLE